ncbi:MAG: kelch repeat-containing protein, partial [Polyangiales bacterium]
FRDAAPETDLVLLSSANQAEELRVLHGKGAPSTFRWSIAGANASVEGERVVLRDARGLELVHSDPIDAIDARGERRVARLAIEGTTLVARFDFEGMRYPIVVDPAWSAGPAMTSPRSQHAMVRLKDGRVLIVGGAFGSTVLSSVDMYDPAAGTITAVAPMKSARAGNAVLLDDGRVLVTGYTYGSEIYDPAANTWTALAPVPNSFEALAKLPDGRALGVGSCTATSDIYNPATGWSAGPAMLAKRLSPQVTVLDDGRVLAVGGDACGGGWLTSAEIWSPSTNTWTSAGTFSATIRAQAAITALPGKKALVTGGSGGSKAATLYDGNTNTWTEMAPMATDRWFHRSSLLPNGRVIVVGGQSSVGSEKVEVWDPVANAWSFAGVISAERITVAVAPLASGALFVAGGRAGGATLNTTEIFTLVPNGGACSQAGECNTGFCVTGLCCDKACNGACEACNLSASSGTCTGVSGDPPAGKTCSGFSCNAGACRATCASASDCDAAHFCNGGACSAKKANGGSCAAAAECTSGTCADGVCCDRACNGQCEACDTLDARGTCVGVVGAPHGTRAACTGTGVGTECGPSCDGKDLAKCTYAKTTAFCSASTCSGTTETHASFCDGAGACKDVPKDCGAYACGATTCRTSCASSGDCAPGSYCKGTTCTRYEDLGVACASGSACKTGFCVDGVCCASAACDAGSTCGATGAAGTCTKRAGSSCTKASDCGSGFCADGVCCDRACDGQCEACDVGTSRGTCTTVVGAPHGGRATCDVGGADTCKARTCDGKDHATCAGFAPETVTCAKAKCDGSTFAAVSVCDGSGTCTPSKTTACAPYACDELGCLGSCAGDKQCADGFSCNRGVCEPKHPHCSDDLSHAIAVDGTSTDCAPYRCGPAGSCLTGCASSSDCGGGAVCGSDKLCVPVDAGTSDTGSGCAAGRRGPGSGIALVSLLALVAAFSARRRR